MDFAKFLENEISVAQSHIEDFDRGATVKEGGHDLTPAWKATYEKRIEDLKSLLAEHRNKTGR